MTAGTLAGLMELDFIMRSTILVFAAFAFPTLCSLWLALAATTSASAADSSNEPAAWPQFRGPNGSAVATPANPPIHFGPESNVVWKVDVAPGHSSPCIWGTRIFLTALKAGKLETICVDRTYGQILWHRSLAVDKLEPFHRIGSPAASTPVTDGKLLYVYFGSYGLVAYDYEGLERWKVPLPPPMVEFGTGSSPILAGDLLIVLCDQDQGSYLLALNKETGKKAWRTERPEFRRSFSSPFIWHHDGEEELVVPGSIWLRSYNLADGKERWSYSGTSRVANSSPTAGDGLLFSASWNVGSDPGDRITLDPFPVFAAVHDKNKDGRLTREEIPEGVIRDRFNQLDLDKDGLATPEEWQVMATMFAQAGNALVAIRPGGRADITKTQVAWKSTRSLPYVASPVYYEHRVYTVKNGGLASCYEAATGRVLYQDERLGAEGDYYASLVGAGGRIHAASQKGVIVIWDAGDELRIQARNQMKEEIMATPAVVGRNLYVRTASKLFAFGQ